MNSPRNRSSGSLARLRRPSPAGGNGFTLIELLVAMTVLAFILLVMTQLFDGTSRATTQSLRTMDTASESRLVFERLGDDLANMVRRGDVDYKLDKKPGSDALAFYAETSGYAPGSASPTRTLATVDYRIHQGSSSLDVLSNYKLERGARATPFDGMLFTDQPSPTAPGQQTYLAGLAPFNTLPLIAAGDYTVLANQVFRLEFCFLLKNGKFSKTPNPPGDVSQPRADPGNFQQVAALVVAIGMLDARSRTLLGDPKSPGYETAFAQLAAALPDVDPDPSNNSTDPRDPTSSRHDILTVWQPKVLEIAARADPGTASLPRPVTSNVRVFQRHYPWK